MSVRTTATVAVRRESLEQAFTAAHQARMQAVAEGDVVASKVWSTHLDVLRTYTVQR